LALPAGGATFDYYGLYPGYPAVPPGTPFGYGFGGSLTAGVELGSVPDNVFEQDSAGPVYEPVVRAFIQPLLLALGGETAEVQMPLPPDYATYTAQVGAGHSGEAMVIPAGLPTAQSATGGLAISMTAEVMAYSDAPPGSSMTIAGAGLIGPAIGRVDAGSTYDLSGPLWSGMSFIIVPEAGEAVGDPVSVGVNALADLLTGAVGPLSAGAQGLVERAAVETFVLEKRSSATGAPAVLYEIPAAIDANGLNVLLNGVFFNAVIGDILTVRAEVSASIEGHTDNVAEWEGPSGEVDTGATAQLSVQMVVVDPVAGSIPSNPLMPDPLGPPWVFAPVVLQPGAWLGLAAPMWFDPPAAVGYEYLIGPASPLIAGVTLPDVGDGLYEVYALHTLTGEEITFAASAWTSYDLLALGLASGADFLRVTGIEPEAGLDPNDPLAFPTGLTFVGPGTVELEMVPLTGGAEIPEPASAALVAVGALAAFRRRRS